VSAPLAASPLLGGLSPEQRTAVLAIDGPVLIIAGAGSGKTRVITHRIAHLVLERGVPSRQILAVTFTNKAANEMKARVEALLSGQPLEGRVSTFHSLCAWLLRREAKTAGLDPAFVIFDEGDQLSAVRQVLRKLGVAETKLSPRAALSRISERKMSSESEGEDSWLPVSGGALCAAYDEQLKSARALDFDDLLLVSVRLLAENGDTLARYRSRFRYILVDEYQDTNRVQFELVRLLAGSEGNLTVVGDEDQSIYSWRGADIRNILDFESAFPGARTLRLQDNYRSSAAILKSAATLIANNRERKHKSLVAKRPSGSPVVVRRCLDEYQEAAFVVQQIKVLPAGRRAAILFRINAQSRLFEEALRRERLTYAVVGAMAFYERREIKDLLAYLRLVANPHDSVAMRRVLNVPPRGLGERSQAQIELLAGERSGSWWDAIGTLLGQGELDARTTRALGGFYEWLGGLANGSPRPVQELLQSVLEATGFNDHLGNDREGLDRQENVRELLRAAGDHDARGTTALADFLDWVALLSPVDRTGDGQAAVTLLTLHAAKGLEFEHVFLVGMEEGLLPHSRSLQARSQLEEERRLCYVGLTRAMDSLCLTWAQSRQLQDRRKTSEPSRFVAELGLANEPGAASSVARFPLGQPRPLPTVEAGEEELRPGMQVRHAVFGVGTVLRKDGTGGETRMTISFVGVGVKRLLARYAQVEVL
jgi:DNA helicase II / ATP-dependent DNA helicase PcrA